MANKTVYPFGTEGRLPSSVGIINDLKTGGADNALSAEQGKFLGDALTSTVTHQLDSLTPVSTGKLYKADSNQIGKAFSAVDTWADANVSAYRISVGGAVNVTYRKFNSGSSYGCLFLDANDIVVGVVVSVTADPSMRTVSVPEGAAYFIWVLYPASITNPDERKCVVEYWRLDKVDQRLDSDELAVSTVQGEIGKTVVPAESLMAYTHFKDGYQLKANNDQLGKTLNNVQTTTQISSAYTNVKIPVAGYSRLVMRQYSTAYEYGSLIVDANDVVIRGIINDTGRYSDIVVDLPEGAAFLVYSYISASSADKSITLYKPGGILDRLDTLENKGSTMEISSGCAPKLTSGRLNSSGIVQADSAYLTTESIFGPVYLELLSGWEVYEGHMVDREGKVVSYQIYHPELTTVSRRDSMRVFSTMNMVPEFGLRLVIRKSDGSAIPEGTNPFKVFISLNDTGYRRWIPEDLPNYDRALRRMAYIQSPRWIALRKVPNGYPASGQTQNAANTYFDLAGRMAIGVPYSDVAQTRKYVPNNVSLRTFMTAVKNRRSLLYTEELNNNTSKYGMSYQSGNRRCYFGEVCSGFTAWVMGSKVLYLSGEYQSNGVPGLSTVVGGNAETCRPLDLLWWNGHVGIVSDIFLDDFGNRKFIVISEMTSPFPFRTIYTPEQFNSRMSSGEIHRWTGWDTIPEPDEARDLSQYLLGDIRQEVAYCPDIMTFAGDYAAFAEGDAIHLNARRNSIYTGVELYKDDVLLQTIDIAGLSADTIVTPNTEDWVDVNLTTLNLTYGKYKARLTDGTNTTDYTYFEIIGITMSATKSGNSVIVDFGSANGTPVSIEQVKENGFANTAGGKYHPVTDEEVSAGTVTLPWGYNSTYKYLLMLVSGDYGTVVKRITQPSA